MSVSPALPSGGARAETKEQARQRLERVEEALRQKRALEKGIASDVVEIQAERERLSRTLVETAARIQQSEGRLTSIEGRLGELEAQEKLLRGSLAERRGFIAHLLAAMQRMGRDPPPVMITRREDALVMVRSAMMLAAAFPQLRTQALALATRLEDLSRVMGDIRTEGERLRTETQRLTDARTQLSALIELRRQSLDERRDALDRVRREAAEISRNVTDLNELIARLDRVVAQQMGQIVPAAPAAPGPVAALSPAIVPVAPAPTVPSGLTPPPAAAPAALAVPPLPAPRPPTEVVLAPSGQRLAHVNPGRIKPAIPFAQARGRLPLPVQGKRIIGFGDKAHTNRSSGIVIETRAGAQVVSPMDGWIVFAGVFRSYGQILIINGGDGYHMLLAGLSQIDVQLGQFVLAGEPVGLMTGAPRGGKAKPPANAPVLYVELRKDGRSIDPDPWWVGEGTQKVQG
ncbi:MAG: peptidoglycan DD-metalloendopeptidase family protein [Hyphomicrobiaceae bacterium]